MNKMFKIEKINIIASWDWNTNDHNCSICCLSLFDNDKSKIVSGTCNHVFHLECISEWLSKKNKCPNCNCNWKYKLKNITNQNKEEINIPIINFQINHNDNNGTNAPSINSYQ
jgi:anaphase-promoting complex subunit 11